MSLYFPLLTVENNKNKKSVKFQGDMLNFCDFIQVFVFTRNHHLNQGSKWYEKSHKMFVFICLCILIQVIPLNIVVLSKFSISMRDNVYPTHYSNHRTGQVIFEAITRLIYNAVGIYASRHARYNEVDL